MLTLVTPSREKARLIVTFGPRREQRYRFERKLTRASELYSRVMEEIPLRKILRGLDVASDLTRETSEVIELPSFRLREFD